MAHPRNLSLAIDCAWNHRSCQVAAKQVRLAWGHWTYGRLRAALRDAAFLVVDAVERTRRAALAISVRLSDDRFSAWAEGEPAKWELLVKDERSGKDHQETDRASNAMCSPSPQLTMRLGVILNISGEKPGPSAVPPDSRT